MSTSHDAFGLQFSVSDDLGLSFKVLEKRFSWFWGLGLRVDALACGGCSDTVKHLLTMFPGCPISAITTSAALQPFESISESVFHSVPFFSILCILKCPFEVSLHPFPKYLDFGSLNVTKQLHYRPRF